MPTDAVFNIATPILGPGESFLVKYRLQPAVIWTQLTPNPITNSFTIPGLVDGCYDFSIQKVKSNGQVCPNAKTGTFCIGDDVCCTPEITSVAVEDLGATRRLTINYDPVSCTPAPDSIRVYYREKDSGDPYTVEDGFVASPIVIEDAETEFEGYIVGLCGETEAAAHAPFSTSCTAPPLTVVWDDETKILHINAEGTDTRDYRVVNAGDSCDAGVPVASGTLVGGAGVDIAGLPAGTYKVCARKVCGEGLYSAWVSSPNFTVSGLAYLKLEGVKLANDLIDPCAGGDTVYIAIGDSNIHTGVTIYTDAGLTTPVLGFDYVTDPGGLVWNLNDGNGVVGGYTGIAC